MCFGKAIFSVFGRLRHFFVNRTQTQSERLITSNGESVHNLNFLGRLPGLYPTHGANNLFLVISNSLWEANNVFRDSKNSLRGANYVFRDSKNSLRGANNESLKPNYEVSSQVNLFQSYANKHSIKRGKRLVGNIFVKLVRRFDYEMCENQMHRYRCVQDHRHSRLCLNVRSRKVRNREPSRLPLRKSIGLLKCKKLRQKYKKIFRKTVPVSSHLHSYVRNYKYWHMKYVWRQDSFYSNFLISKKKSKITYNLRQCKQRILLSGDVELNPGPQSFNEMFLSNEILSLNDPWYLLKCRMLRYGLKPLDVGGGGDCLFKSISHQLYGHSDHHLQIRAAGIRCLANNPERFVESIVDMPWSQYLSNMSTQGTWADHVVIQAVSDAMNLKIQIMESNPAFSEITIVEPAVTMQNPRLINIGHIGETHYVSTCSVLCTQASNHVSSNNASESTNLKGQLLMNTQESVQISLEKNNTVQNFCSSITYTSQNCGDFQSSPAKRAKQNEYIRNYRVKNASSEFKAKLNEKKRIYRQKNASAEKKAKRNEKQRIYRQKNASPAKKAKSNQYQRNYREKSKISIDLLIRKFHEIVNQGPLYICTCCDQLWYKHGVIHAVKLRQLNADMNKYLYNKISVDNKEWVCKTCYNHLIKRRIPPCAIANGMVFPNKPEFFDLNELECRLLAPRIAFQKLMQAPRGQQLKIHGNIVNVPADVTHTVSMLPRLPSQNATIKINLKRKLQYKSSALSLNVRPYKVIQAAQWLISNSNLYRDEGIVFNNDWMNNFNVNIDQSQTDDNFSQLDSIDANQQSNDLSEDETEITAGVTDTMFTATDFLEDDERQNILNLAPAEGNRPLSVFRDKYCEELAYPGIFLGQARTENENRKVNINYSDICKSELRRSDRRAAMCVENIFYKTKKMQMKILLGKSHIAVRKCKGNNRSINAGQLKQHGVLDRLIRHDEGYKFLNALRGSPPYFEKAKKDLFAMIRQLGPATLFCSFSSAETQWLHLLRILGQLVDNKQYTKEQLESLNWQDRCRLIQSDPVTCARHFDYQVNQFLTNFLLSSAQPLGKISDWFYRVEYQQRGSPHIHMLIWLENAPKFHIDSDKEITAFIDKVITCHKPDENAELQNLVNRQMHRHSHTCRKNTNSQCRFNYPQPPMKDTIILSPLDQETSQNEVKLHKQNWKAIKKYLDDMKEGEEISFDQFLLNLCMTEEHYLLAIRSSLNAPTVFLQRKPNELLINNYNPACLSAWRANMDIQFVLDVYACAVYIVNYISKGQKGMSELLRQACIEARQGNNTIKQQVRDIGSKFLNNVEVSAQEAVYIVLQLPMRKASREIIFINTSPPAERVELLKPINDIENMEDDCEEIYTSGLLKRYCKRPAKLENLTLADWAAWYDHKGKPYIKQTNEVDVDGLPLENFIDDNQNDDGDFIVEENNHSTKTRKRRKARIIRSVWFNKQTEPEKHYRELLMLFTPWRNEETDLLGVFSTYQERFMMLSDIISQQMKEYAICNEDFNEIQQEMRRIDERYDNIAPCTEHMQQQDQAEGDKDLHPDFAGRYNLSDDLGIPSVDSTTEPLIMNELQDDEYRTMVQMLNKEQKEFFDHVLHLIKTSDEPFFCFLSGGAGVGKSHVTKALYQAAIKYYNTRAGVNFAQTKVLMLAPTGKAAYNIKGNTIHNALSIPASQSLKNYKSLDASRLNTIRCQLGGIKLIFIDEISMVGNTMFNIQINNRLKDIKGSSLPFGGVSIVAIGDLFQLQPVMDGYIFKNMNNDEYGVLAPNIWQELFKMFELHEIMRQRESKNFAELLNRLREGDYTNGDIKKLKERIVDSSNSNYPSSAPHLFIQNAKVNEFNDRAHNALSGTKYSIKAHDSVIGAESHELREKILKQVPSDPRKTKQLHSVLKLAVGERTEISLNTRTDDGMTNGAGNVIKLIQIHQSDKPSGIIWVQFDHADVGQKTRHDNRQLYTHGIESTWTPIKPVTTQFAVGRTRSVQVVRKQFPLRPAAAKTIHRSQGDTETRIVVNFETRRSIPHIHYVGLSRVTTIDGLYITNLCENKIAVSDDVKNEMHRLRTEGQLTLSVTPMYKLSEISFKVIFLNARSLHKHIDDIRKDLNYLSSDVNIFAETRFSPFDSDSLYSLGNDNYTVFRNDAQSTDCANNIRPFGGTAVYSRLDYYPGYPYSSNTNGVEITMTRFMIIPHITIVAIYRSPAVSIRQMCNAIKDVLHTLPTKSNLFIGDFNVNWLNSLQRMSLYNLFIRDNDYRQVVACSTTDSHTCIDHIYTNLPDSQVSYQILETYFSDHKAICAIVNCFD